MSKVYLKPNIAVEPLFCNWYLWSYLVPPHVAGLFLKNRHLKTLQSFLDFPELHKIAAQDLKLLGGQFMNVTYENLDKVGMMLKETNQMAAPLINLAKDIETFNKFLLEEAKGQTMELMYSHVPASLKGCVELVYDHNNFPMLYFFESFLYDKYFDNNLFSVLLTPIMEDKRKFVLSTPRLSQEREVELRCSPTSIALNMLCDSRTHGVEINTLVDELQISGKTLQTLEGFFSHNPPTKIDDCHYFGDGVRVRYFGHACVLLQTKTMSILIDPLISYCRPEGGMNRFVLEDLPEEIDFVVFTHNHLDHIAFETLLFLKNKVKNFIFPRSLGGTLLDPDLKLILHKLGYNGLMPLDKMESICITDGTITCVPFLGEHGDLNIQTKAGFIIELLGNKFLFAADSNNIESVMYNYLHAKFGSIDTLFLGMECHGAPLDWIYGPLLTVPVKHAHKQSRRYSGSDAARAYSLIEALKPQQVYIYAMGEEKWLSHIMSLNYQPDSIQLIESRKLIEDCKKINIYVKRLYGQDEWSYANEL